MNIFVTAFLPLTLFVIMFSLGLGLVVDDFRRILTHPKAFAVGIFSQMVMLPAVGFLLAIGFDLTPELALGLVILALCPGGATANLLTRLAYGDVALSISVTSVSTLLAVVTMPLLAKLAAGYFLGVDAADIDVTGLALSMVGLTTVPVCAAMAVRHFATAFALRIERGVSRAALLLMVTVIGIVLATNWTMFVDNLPLLGPSVFTLNAVMLLGGIVLAWLFRLSERHATAISLEAGIQNAALGVNVGSLIVDHGNEVSPISVPSGVYGIVMYAMCVAFTFWRRSRPADAA